MANLQTISTHEATNYFTSKLRWCIERLDIDPQSSAAVEFSHTLLSGYTESWRIHHDVHHPVDMIRELVLLDGKSKQVLYDIQERLFMYLVILGHDVVIKLGRKPGWNEEMSAVIMYDFLGGVGKPELAMQVHDAIICSSTHTINDWFLDKHNADWVAMTELFLDLDLSSLGWSTADCLSRTEEMWREKQITLTRREFQDQIATWALSTLRESYGPGKPGLFKTTWFQDQNDQAEENLLRLSKMQLW